MKVILHTKQALSFLSSATSRLVFFLIVSFSFIAVKSNAQFTAGGLIVERVGTGSAALTSAANPIFLDEYSVSGTLITSVAMPTVTAAPINRIAESGTSGNDGFLNLSADGRYLVVSGYDAAPGTASIAGAGTNKVITRVDASGAVGSTVFTNASFCTGSNFCSAASTDGSQFWGAGQSSTTGVNGYISYQGTTTATAAVVTATVSGSTLNAQAYIYGGNYYFTNTSNGVYSVTGLPTTTATPTLVGSGKGYGMVIVNDGGTPVMYYTNGATKVYKYALISGSWTAEGDYQTTGATYYGITAVMTGTVPTIYVTNGTNILAFNDATAATFSVSGTAPTTTVVATAATYETFRGITFAPNSQVYTQVSTGMASSPLVASATAQPLISFSVASVGTSSLTALTFTTTSTPATGLTNVHLLKNGSALGYSPTVVLNAGNISITGLTESLASGSSVQYTLVADIVSTVSASTPNIQLSFGNSGITTTGNPATFTTFTSTNYSFIAPPAITGSPSANTVCSGSNTTFTVSATNAPAYQWERSTTGTAGTFSVITSGSFDAGVTYAGFTTATLTLTGATTAINGYAYKAIASNIGGTVTATAALLTVNSSPTTIAGTTGPSCVAGTLTLTSTPAGGTGTYTYAWSGAGTFSSTTAGNPTVSGLSAGNPVYTLTVTDGNTCTVSATTTATVNPLPSPTISGSPSSITLGGSALLTFTGNNGDVVYYWNGSTTVTTTIGGSGTTTISVSPTVTTTYSVTSATSAFGCSQSISGQTATINVSAAPTAAISVSGPATICSGNSSTLLFTGTAAATVYYWNSASGGTSSIVLSGSTGTGTASASVSPSVTTTYTVSSVYSGGISYTVAASSAAITVSAPAITSIGADPSVCAGSTLHLNAAISGGIAPYTYVWNGSNSYTASTNTSSLTNSVTVTSISSTPTTPSYTLSVTDNIGCIANGTNTVSSTVNPLPTASITGTASIISGGSTPLTFNGTANAAVTYAWSGSSPVTATLNGSGSYSVAVSPSVTTTYTLTTVTSAAGCTQSVSGQSVTVTVAAPTIFYSKSSGTLDVLGTWGSNTDGSGVSPASFTASGQTFNIVNNASPTLAAAWSVGSNTVNVGYGGTAVNFIIPSSYSVTGTGPVNVAATATLTLNNPGLPTIGTMDPASTIYYNNGVLNTPSVNAYGNIVFNGAGCGVVSTGTFSLILEGNLTVQNSATFSNATLSLYTKGANNQVISSNGTPISIKTFDDGNTYTKTGTLTLAANTPLTTASSIITNCSGSANQFSDGGNTITCANNVTTIGNYAGYNFTGTLVLTSASGTAKLSGDPTFTTVPNAKFNNITINVGASNVSFLPASGGSIYINGNLYVQAITTKTVTLNANTIYLGGNYIYAPTANLLNATGSTLVFSGTGAQTYSTNVTGGQTLNNVTINNGSGVTLYDNLGVSGTLGLTNGVITTGVSLLNVASTGTVSGGSVSSYVNGKLQMAMPASTTSIVYKVGDVTYSPVQLTFPASVSSGSITVTSSSSVIATPNISSSYINTANAVNRYWTIANSGVSVSSVTAAFSYNVGDLTGGSTSNSGYILEQYSGGAWSAAPSVTNSTTASSPLQPYATVTTGLPFSSSYTATVVAGSPACSPSAGTATASPSSVCASGTATVGVTGVTGASGVSYQWLSSPTGTSSSYSPISGATSATYITPAISAITYYECSVGCIPTGTYSVSNSTVITVSSPAITSISADASVCAGSTLHLNTAVSGGSAPYTYAWSGSGGYSASTSSSSLTNSVTVTSISVTPTNPSYTLTVTDNSGCTASGTNTVASTVNPLPTASVTGTASIISGANTPLTFTGTANAVVTYIWTGSSPVTATLNGSGTYSVSVSPTVTTTYSLTAATSAAGCSQTISGQTATVTVAPVSPVFVWTGAAGDITWGTATNWTSSVVPTSAAWAQYSVAGTSSVVVTTPTVATGAIDVANGRTITTSIRSNISGGTTFTLNGATVYSVSNTVLSNATNTGSYTTTQLNLITSADPLNIAFNNSAPVILGAAGTSSTVPTSDIDITANITSSGGPITYLGGGTWNGVTGSCGGVLQLGGVNTFTTPLIIGNSDGTSNGELELDATTAINNSATNTITINNNSQLYLAAAANATYSTSATTLYLNGTGGNWSLTGTAALFNLNSGYTWPGAIVLTTTGGIASNGSGSTFTLSGPISGTGELVKSQGKGTLIISGPAAGNTWSGGTSINNGNLTVNSGSALGTGILNPVSASTKATLITFQNAAQTVNGLSSAGSLGIGNVITLTGTALTVNQNTSDGIYGTGAGGGTNTSVITGTGSIIKTGSYNLILTSPGNTFSGGLTVTNGGVIFNPVSTYTVSMGSCPVTLNGGTLGTYAESGTYSVTPNTLLKFATLNVQNNSTIALDPAHTNTITFTASNGTSWAAGQELTITGWQGSFPGGTAGTTGRIYVGTSAAGLTNTQLGQIQFNNGGTNYPATLLSTGELVPAAAITIATITPSGPLCNSSSHVLTVNSSVNGSVSGTYSVQASNASGIFSDLTSNIIGTGTTPTLTATIPAGFAAGSYKIRILNGTPLTVGAAYSVSVIVNGSPSITATATSGAVCSGSNLSLNTTISGGTANYTYSWSGPNSFTSSSNTASLTNTVTVSNISSTPANPVYTISVTDANNCTASASVTGTVNATPSPTISGTAFILTGSSTTLTFTGNSGDVVYYWNGSSIVSTTISGSGSTGVSVSPTVTTTYSVTSATSLAGCTVATVTGQTATVTISSTPTADISGNATICEGSSTVLSFAGSAGGIVYYWDGGIGATSSVMLSGSTGSGTANVTVSPSVTASYTLTSIYSGGTSYSLTGTALVTVSNPVITSIGADAAVCAGSTLHLGVGISGGISPYTYSWSGSNSYSSYVNTTVLVNSVTVTSISVTPSNPSYSVTITDNVGCLAAGVNTVTSTVIPLPNVYSVTGGGAYCAGGTVSPIGLSNSDNGINYQLYNGSTAEGSPVAGTASAISFGSYTAAGVYSVVATSAAGGCVSNMSGNTPVSMTTAGSISGAALINPGNTLTLTTSGTTGGTWTSGAVSIATITASGGVVTGISGGIANITYTAPGCSSLQAVATVTVTSTAFIWTGNAGDNIWSTAGNWTSSVVPTASAWAQYSVAGTGTAVGITTATVAAGAIDVAAARTTLATTITNNYSAASTLTLNGAVVYSVTNTVLSNASTGLYTTAPLTLSSGANPLNIIFNNSAPVILGATGTSAGPAASSEINITGNITAAGGPVTFLGGGTWNGGAGYPGALLKLGGTNSFTTPLIIGNSDGTSDGILELDAAGAINNSATNTITINNNSQLFLNAATGTTYTTSLDTLYLNGQGNNTTLTKTVALYTTSGNTYTWPGTVVFPTTTGIEATGSSGSLTFTGPVIGPGALLKNYGAGNLIFTNAGNNWAGGTTIANGKITVNSGASFGTGALLMDAGSGNTVSVNFNNAAQTINGLSSAGSSGSTGNTLTLGSSTVLTINQLADASFGGGTTGIITGGGAGAAIIKAGSANLVLTSPGSTFTGSLTVTAGGLIFNPATAYTVSLGSCPVTLNGGTLGSYAEGGTYSVTAGTQLNFSTLNIQGNSAIALDPNNTHVINFANSNGVSWSSGSELTITGWQGSYSGGTTGTKGQIFIGSDATGLTSTQLGQVQFYNGVTNYPATILSTGELVPAAAITITTITPTGPLCNSSSNTLTVVAAVNGSVSGTYSVQASNASGVFSDVTSHIIGTGSTHTLTATIPAGFAAGTYNIRVLNGTPLTVGTAYGSPIIVNGSPSITATGNGGAVCVGSTLSLNAAVSGGTANYTYSWSGPGSFTSSANTSATTNTVTTGSVAATPVNPVYTVVVTDANNCTATGTTIGTVNPTPSPVLSGNSSIASGGSAVLTFTGNAGDVVSYTWTGGATATTTLTGTGTGTSMVSVSPTVTTTYSVTSAVSATGCSNPLITGQTATVTVTTNPTASISGSTLICPGGNAVVSFSGTAGATVYYWNGGTSAASSILLSGSTGIGTANVTVSPSVTAVYTLSSVYSGGSSYSVSGSATVTVSTPVAITSIGADASVCAGSTLHLNAAISGGVSPYVYVWNGANSYSATTSSSSLTNSVTVTSVSVTPANPAYTVTVTDNHGCIATGTNTVTTVVNPLPVASVTGTASIFSGASTPLSFTGTPNAVVSYAWGSSSTATATLNGSGTYSVAVSPTVTTTYTLTAVTSAAGCLQSVSGQTVTVTVNTATVFYSKSTGNLNVLGTWGSNTDGSGVSPTSFATTHQLFNVVNNPAPTISAAWAVAATSTVTVGNGSAAINFTVPPTYSIGGTLNAAANATVTYEYSVGPTFGTLDPASTIFYHGFTVTPSFFATAPTYGNIVFDSCGISAPSSSSKTITFAGNFTLQNLTTFTTGVVTAGVSLVATGTANQTINANGIPMTVYNFTDNKTSGNLTLAAHTNITVNNTMSMSLSGGTGNQFIDGGDTVSLNNSIYLGGTASSYSLTGTLNFTAATATQYIGGSSSVTPCVAALNNVIINSSGAGTAVVALNTAGGSTLTVAGKLQVTATGGISLNGNTLALGGNFVYTPATDYFTQAAGNTLLFDGSAAQSYSTNVTAGNTINNVTINHASTLNLHGLKLNILNTLNNNGTVSGGGTLNLDGSSPQVLQGNGVVDNLTLSNSAGATINTTSDTVGVKGELLLSAGTFTTNGSLMLLSDSCVVCSNSDSLINGYIGPIASGAGISGRVVVQQFVPRGVRAYRFIAHPFTASVPLSQIEPFIDITGPGGSSEGFTTTITNAASAYWYSPLYGNSAAGNDPGWRSFKNTFAATGSDDTDQINQYEGLRLFVRGSKGQGLDGSTYIPNPVTYRTYGNVNTGTVYEPMIMGTASVSGTPSQRYNLLGNPYPAVTDIGAVISAANTAGKIYGADFYVWNPYIGPYGTGAFVTIPVGTPHYYLGANESFEVQTAGTYSLVFTESNKSTVVSAALMKTTTDQAVTLHVYDNAYHLWDMLSVQFNDSATDNEDAHYDGSKPPSPQMFSFYSLSADSVKLAVDSRPYSAGKVIPLGMASSYAQDLIIKAENVSTPEGGQVYLHDKLLETYTLLEEGTEYKFTITKDAATQGDKRFELSMNPTAVNAVTSSKQLQVQMVPNPATSEVTINYSFPSKAQTAIHVMNVEGVTVLTQDLGVQQSGMAKVSLDKLASGVYLVEVTSGTEKAISRLVKE